MSTLLSRERSDVRKKENNFLFAWYANKICCSSSSFTYPCNLVAKLHVGIYVVPLSSQLNSLSVYLASNDNRGLLIAPVVWGVLTDLTIFMSSNQIVHFILVDGRICVLMVTYIIFFALVKKHYYLTMIHPLKQIFFFWGAKSPLSRDVI